jgi:hypothetical protein
MRCKLRRSGSHTPSRIASETERLSCETHQSGKAAVSGGCAAAATCVCLAGGEFIQGDDTCSCKGWVSRHT